MTISINQGDIYWILARSAFPHPHVVIQNNADTVIVCALTSNLKRVSLPGNVLLEAGEANLPKPSVVEVSKLSTVEKAQLGDYIGTLNQQRVDQILSGLRFLHQSFFTR